MNFLKRLINQELSARQEFLFFTCLVLIPNLLMLFICVWPGFLQADQIFSSVRFKMGEPNQWHSFLFTLITFPFFNNAQALGLYGVLYDVVFSVTVAWSIMKLKHLDLLKSQKGCIFFALIFALSPTFLCYTNVLYSSESLFMVVLLPLTIFLIEIVKTKGAWLGQKTNWIKLAVVLFVAFELRKNAVLMVFCLVVVFFIVYKEQRRRIIWVAGSVFLVALVSTGGMRLAGVTPSPSQELASIPAQQIARVYVDGGYIPSDMKERLNQIHPEEYWIERYVPSLADNEKLGIQVNVQFISDWLVLGMHNPMSYLNAYLDLTESFWLWGSKPEHLEYPNGADFMLLWEWTPEYAEEAFLGKAQLSDGFFENISKRSTLRDASVLGWDYLMYGRTVPVISDVLKGVFFNIALPFYLCLAVFIVAIAKRKGGVILIATPLWTTVLSFLLFAPAAYFRYSVMMGMIVPVIMLVLIDAVRKKESVGFAPTSDSLPAARSHEEG